MKSKTKIEEQADRKNNPILAQTIKMAKKNDGWLEVASLLSRPKRISGRINLGQVDEMVKSGEKVVVPGKILGEGNITKKVEIIAFGFSGQAKIKLDEKGCVMKTIKEEIKNNPEAKGVRILK